VRPTTEEYNAVIQELQRPRGVLEDTLHRTFGITHHWHHIPGPTGLKRAVAGAPIPSGPVFSGLQEIYRAFSPWDPEFRYVGKRAQASGAPDFASAIAGTMNWMLARDYGTDYHWRDLVTSFTSADNYKPQRRMRVGPLPDLGDVGEDANYNDLDPMGEDLGSFTINKKGGQLYLTDEAILADDIGLVTRIVEQIRRSCWRTLAKRVWNLFISNATYGGDSLDCFHATHGNLGASALTTSTLTTAREAIFAQKEGGSDERLGLSGPFLLVVPIEIEKTAIQINQCQFVSGSTDANEWFHRFGDHNERIFANPLCADPNDWYLFDLSGRAEIAEACFLNGQQTPQVFIADDPRRGANFAGDRIYWKIRHEYECSIRDYRACYKAVVP
jgi:hypothetical protein